MGRAQPAANQERVVTALDVPEHIAWRVPSVWIWPPLALVAVATAGQFVGWVAAAVVFGAAVATAAACVAAKILARPAFVRFVAAALCAGGALTTVLVMAVAPVHQGQASDLRGQRVTAQTLARSDLRGANLAGASLDGLDLSGRDLAGVSAAGASFVGTRLQGASLRGADLSGADLARACMRGADLAGAILAGANVEGADLVMGTLHTDAVRALRGEPASRPPEHCRR